MLGGGAGVGGLGRLRERRGCSSEGRPDGRGVPAAAGAAAAGRLQDQASAKLRHPAPHLPGEPL